MKKLTILFVPVLILVTLVLPVKAMVGGEMDDEHTNVGAIVLEWPFDDEHPEITVLARLCTATLIHNQVLVSAAHCFSGLENAGLGGVTLYVTFNQDAVPEGIEIDPETDPDYLEVLRYIKHPDYNAGTRDNDLALVVLDENVKNIKIEKLPKLGYMDDITQSFHRYDKKDINFIFIGYGAQGIPDEPIPDLYLDAVRKIGGTTYQNLQPLEIVTSNEGDAVICQGDSGGPVFHVDGKNETLVGVHSKSGSYATSCDGLGLTFKYRLDTPAAQDFIHSELDKLE